MADRIQILDDNGRVAGGGLPFFARKRREYTGASGLGATGTTTLFTVTGDVMVRVFGICHEDIAGAGTLEVGIANNTAGLLAQIADATALDNGEIYVDATPAKLESVNLTTGLPIANGDDIIETIGSTNLTDGIVTFYCFWRPLSSGAAVVAA